MNEKWKWMRFLDWSTMQKTFEQLSLEQKKFAEKKCYWSLGKGVFQK
jgi:hypothetical protein